MSSSSTRRATVVPACLAGLLVAACGSSAPSNGAASLAPNANAAAAVALTRQELPPGLGSLFQEPDQLLAGAANTNARVFFNTDRTATMEVDLAVDTTAAAATSDYPAYRSAASRQVPHQTATSMPIIGSQSDEFVGTTNNGRNVVSISFLLSRVICVITYASTSAIDRTTIESAGLGQAVKIRSAKL
jgi:hypothetical protein